jgi:hypothetical protein
MVLINEIVQLRRWSAATAPAECTAMLQFGEGAGVRRMSIHVDYAWPDPIVRG